MEEMTTFSDSKEKRARTVAIGVQNFESLIIKNNFYVDKTNFIKEWWESDDAVTLIMRPRRFGKTLNMNMLERFFSNRFKGNSSIFEDLNIWKEEKYRKLQGTYPVIFLSFAGVKATTYEGAKEQILQVLKNVYGMHKYLMESGLLDKSEQEDFKLVGKNMSDSAAALTLHQLCYYLSRYYSKKVIVLLDEYDTPLQEAYVNGYWDELSGFIRDLFNNTFKTNPYLERAVMTGITRVSKESMFSDLNNLAVVTTTSDQYSDAFGFTQEEVSDALAEFGISEMEGNVRNWYDGFTFGNRTDIYNPWSIINFLKAKKFSAYWANTSSNSLAGKLIREGSRNIKMVMEDLLAGGVLHTKIDEQIVFNRLDNSEAAIWSLLLASGYLKVENYRIDPDMGEEEYELKITNMEVKMMFKSMIRGWFEGCLLEYNDFIKALLLGDLDAMNEYMNEVALQSFSSFDVARNVSSKDAPERFYHGFVLGMIVDLSDRYHIISNRESGFGRYDIMLKPLDKTQDAIIIEFKVHKPNREASLEETVQSALKQIEDKQYDADLLADGIQKDCIHKYGFAFKGKEVLIGSAESCK